MVTAYRLLLQYFGLKNGKDIKKLFLNNVHNLSKIFLYVIWWDISDTFHDISLEISVTIFWLLHFNLILYFLEQII